MKRLYACLLASLCLPSACLLAQNATPRPSETPSATPSLQAAVPPAAAGTPIKLVDEFFGLLKSNSIDTAYAALLRGSKIADSKDDVATLKAKTREALQAFGDIQDCDQIASKRVGTHLMSYTYIVAAKNCPVRFRLFFYRATDVWKLVDIRIDDRLGRMFEDTDVTPGTPAETPQ